ncbi:hypothetical protein [Listeria cornellensis]|uniref:hypothetical protein n=1 Tax=Listeria cornellensis TaxID=1494961 RepID=UPI0004AF67AC
MNIPFEQDGETFTAVISVTEIAKLSMPDQETRWKFKVNASHPYSNLSTDGPITNKPVQSDESLYRYHFEFPEGILTLVNTPLETSTHLENFSMNEKEISGTISISTPLLDGLFEARLLLKRRPTAQFYLFHEQYQAFDLGVIINNRVPFSIPTMKISSDFLVDNSNVLDVIIDISPIKIGKRLPTYLSIGPDVKHLVPKKISLDLPLLTSLESYVTGSNRLSFYFGKDYQDIITLTQLHDKETEVFCQFKSKIKISPSQIVAKRRDRKAKAFEYNLEQTWPVKKGLTKSTASISKQDFLSGPVNKPDTTWDFFVRSDDFPDLPIAISDTIDLSSFEYFDIASAQFKSKTH